MRSLVTGGAGFIGSNLVHYLLPKNEVEKLVVLDSLTYAGHQLSLGGAQEFSKYSFSNSLFSSFFQLSAIFTSIEFSRVGLAFLKLIDNFKS